VDTYASAPVVENASHRLLRRSAAAALRRAHRSDRVCRTGV